MEFILDFVNFISVFLRSSGSCQPKVHVNIYSIDNVRLRYIFGHSCSCQPKGHVNLYETDNLRQDFGFLGSCKPKVHVNLFYKHNDI